MKLKEVTPEALRCAVGPCAAVFLSDRGTYLIIGKRVLPEAREALPPGKVAPDEEVVEVSVSMIHGLLTNRD